MILVESLAKHGIIPRKTFKLEPPKIRRDLVNHWIRGYFDGDGCVSIDKLGNKRGCFMGTYSVINFIYKKCPALQRPTKVGKMWITAFSGNKKAKQVCQYLYNNSSVFLSRKKTLFDQERHKEKK